MVLTPVGNWTGWQNSEKLPIQNTRRAGLEVGARVTTGPVAVPRYVDRTVHWWILIPIAAVVVAALYALFRWASADPAIDAEIAKERFRDEQDWRGLHRSAIDAPDRHR